MQLRKGHPELTVLEAVDNLSLLAELDLIAPEEKSPQTRLTEEQISERMHALSWFDPDHSAFNRERIKETFATLLKYMKELYERDKGQLREEQTQRGFHAIMLLAQEAAEKIDSCTDLFMGDNVSNSAVGMKEFRELQHFYHTKVVQRFSALAEAEGTWSEEWGKGEAIAALQVPLRDLELVRRDQQYELFQIRKEDNTPWFNRTVLRHLHLMGQFDVLLRDRSMEDPFLRLEMILDREAHLAAREILHAAFLHIDEFYREAQKFKTLGFVASIAKALMALMLAANARNLMQNAVGKHSLNYYADFHDYLREGLTSSEYARFIASPPDLSEAFLHSVVNLTHTLCTAFFMKTISRREMIGLIRSLIGRGEKGSVTSGQTCSPLSLWNNMRDEDSSIRSLFKELPNGPLMQTLKLFEEKKELGGFDPIAKSNEPSHLYTLASTDLHISCIRLPAPVFQSNIAKADIVEEFCGFIRSLALSKRNQRHLLINLQDRTSLIEHARCEALEQIHKREFKEAIRVVTFPKHTDFYLQAGSYIDWDDAAEFMKQLKEQVSSGEECGFYFPPAVDMKDLLRFSEGAIQTIHSLFFGGKNRLERKNRLDFIEIFYFLLTLKLIENFKPDTLSFTCKDAIDTGAAASAGFFAFLRILNDPSHWSREEKDFIQWMLYAPALALRRRAIDALRFNRMVSALSIVSGEVEAHHAQTVAALNKLYKISFFRGVQVKEAS